MEPVAWGKGREAEFIARIDFELIEAQGARVGIDRQFREWLSQYRTPARQATRQFPYEGASGYSLPLTAIDVDVLYARFMQTIHAPENLWTTEALNERWLDAAKPLQDFLTVLDTRLLRMFDVNKRVFLETVKLGTGIYKTGWKYERRPVWTYDTAGKRVRAERIVSAPFVDHVRLTDFVMPAYAYAIEPDAQGGAPWVAERLRISVARLRSMAQATDPALPNLSKDAVDTIARYVEMDKPPLDVKIQELDFANKRGGPSSTTKLDGDDFDRDRERGTPGGASYQRPKEVELWEIHARFPTRDGHSEDDIEVWYHQPTRRIVRAIYQRYAHGARPYNAIRYFPGDGFFGIGVCEQKEMFQTLSSDLMNFTLDNVLLANSRMIVAKSGAHISPGEPVYPYKVWMTDDDVRKDFGVFPMADIYPSLPIMQQFVHQMGEKRTSIGDVQLGQLQSLPGRTPATTMMSLLQEGNRRPDFTIRDMRSEGLSVVGTRILELCQQFISSPVDYEGRKWLQMTVDMLGMPEGLAAAEKLRTPLEPVSLGLGVSLTATSASSNKEVERQGQLALLQLAGQVTPQFLQLVQIAVQAQGTPLGEVALNSARGLQELYKRTLETYDVRNVESILPLVDAMGSQGGAPNGSAVGPNGAGFGGAQSPAFDPALAALPGGAGASGGATGF